MEPPRLIQNEAHQQCLEAVRAARANSQANARAAETDQERQKRLDAAKAYKEKSNTTETLENRQKRLDRPTAKAYREKSKAAATTENRLKRLDAANANRQRSRDA